MPADTKPLRWGNPDPIAVLEVAAAKREREMQADHDACRKPGERRLRFRVSPRHFLSGDFAVSFWDEVAASNG